MTFGRCRYGRPAFGVGQGRAGRRVTQYDAVSGEATPKRALTAQSEPPASVAVDGTSSVSSVSAPRQWARPALARPAQPQHRHLGLPRCRARRRGCSRRGRGRRRRSSPGPPATGISRATPVRGSTAKRPPVRAVVEDERAVGELADPVGVHRGPVTGGPVAGERQELRAGPGRAAAPVEPDRREPVDRQPRVGDPHGALRHDEVVEEDGAGDDDVGDDRAGPPVDGPHVPDGADVAGGPDEAGARVAEQAADLAAGGPGRAAPWCLRRRRSPVTIRPSASEPT